MKLIVSHSKLKLLLDAPWKNTSENAGYNLENQFKSDLDFQIILNINLNILHAC